VEDYFVVVNGNEIVGAGGINLEKDQKIGKISWDFLHPVHQGQGIGTQLLQHRLNILRKNPLVNRIIVRTSQYAEKFYAKNGFKLIGVQKNYWAPGFDLYKMEI
jgi:GNAT superfamily N-acetyltransferase